MIIMGLTPSEERRSFIEFPLPESDQTTHAEVEAELSDDDKFLPSRIAVIDHDIDILEEQLKQKRNERALLLDYAIKINSMEDPLAKIVKNIKWGNRIADAQKLKDANPEKFKIYEERWAEKARHDADTVLQNAKDNLMKTVNLSIAEKVFGKSIVTKCSELPSTTIYTVVIKGD